MKASVMSLENKEVESTELPVQFNEEIRPDLIRKVVRARKLSSRQPYGASPEAGKRHSAQLSKRRRNYRGTYGIGQSRTPRKVLSRRGRRMFFVGAFAPQTVGGRRAHPPKAEKILRKKINKKEQKKAVRSAISATADKNYVKIKHHVPSKYPFLVEKKIETIKKAKDVKDLLEKLGFDKELNRCATKTLRAGKGKMRGRKYKSKVGPLIVVSQDCNLSKAARNLQGVETIEVGKLNVEVLAPGAVPGRLTVWTQGAIDKLAKEKLYL